MAEMSRFQGPVSEVGTARFGGATLSVDKSAAASPGFLEACKDACKNLWSEISWRLVGDKYADKAIEKFAKSLSINSGQIEALQQRLEAGTFIDQAKAGYGNSEHQVALTALNAPVGAIFRKASADAGKVFDTIEQEVLTVFKYSPNVYDNPLVYDRSANKLQVDFLQLLKEAQFMHLSPAQKKGLTRIYSELLPQAERELNGIVNSADSAIQSLDPLKGLVANDKKFLSESKLAKYTPNDKVGAAELDKVNAFYEKGRAGVFLELSNKLTKAATSGSAEGIATATTEAQSKLEALQKKTEGVLDLLERSVDVPKAAAERAKSLGLDKEEAIAFVSTNKDGEPITARFSSLVSHKIRTLWAATVEAATEESRQQRTQFLNSDLSDPQALEAAVSKVSTQHADAEALVKAAGKTLTPFAVMSREKGHERETEFKRFIAGLDEKLRQPAGETYDAFKRSTEEAVVRSFQLMESGTKAVVEAVQNAAWRNNVLSGAIQGMITAPGSAQEFASLSNGLRENLEQVEASVRESVAIQGSPIVKKFLGGRVAEAAQAFRSAVEEEAGKEKPQDWFASSGASTAKVEALKITAPDIEKAERIAGVLSVTPEAERAEFAKGLFARLFPAKDTKPETEATAPPADTTSDVA